MGSERPASFGEREWGEVEKEEGEKEEGEKEDGDAEKREKNDWSMEGEVLCTWGGSDAADGEDSVWLDGVGWASCKLSAASFSRAIRNSERMKGSAREATRCSSEKTHDSTTSARAVFMMQTSIGHASSTGASPAIPRSGSPSSSAFPSSEAEAEVEEEVEEEEEGEEEDAFWRREVASSK